MFRNVKHCSFLNAKNLSENLQEHIPGRTNVYSQYIFCRYCFAFYQAYKLVLLEGENTSFWKVYLNAFSAYLRTFYVDSCGILIECYFIDNTFMCIAVFNLDRRIIINIFWLNHSSRVAEKWSISRTNRTHPNKIQMSNSIGFNHKSTCVNWMHRIFTKLSYISSIDQIMQLFLKQQWMSYAVWSLTYNILHIFEAKCMIEVFPSLL